MHYLRTLVRITALLALSAAVWSTLHAQEKARVKPTIYMSGGIGKDEQAVMRKAAGDFSLRLEFSAFTSGEYVAGENIVIQDASGAPVFVLASAGPMVNVQLPRGTYKVSASYRGMAESKEVQLDGQYGKDLYFRWMPTTAPKPLT